MIEKHLETKKEDKLEVNVKQQQRTETVINSQRRIKGLTLWEYNTKENVLKEAEFESVDVVINPIQEDIPEVRRKVILRQNCIYFQKLNRNNAVKHIVKIGYKKPKL